MVSAAVSGSFDPDEYWRANGPYLAGPGAATPEHVLTESILAATLPDLGPIADVLDVGCGRGRLAALLAEVLPDAAYSGVDVGAAQVEATKLVRPEGTFYETRIQDFAPLAGALDDRQWDLVLCSEMLMHIPPADIEEACHKVKRLARKWLVTIDWTEPLPGHIAEWNWLYNYPALFGSIDRVIPAGLQSIFLVKP